MTEENTGTAQANVKVDLHGYSVRTAVYEVAPAMIEAAWRKGYSSVTLVHGSPDVTDRDMAQILGRGGIKWALRRELNRGAFMKWAWYSGSVKHKGLDPDSGALTLALRPNPEPEPDLPWPDVSGPIYDYEGPWHRKDDIR